MTTKLLRTAIAATLFISVNISYADTLELKDGTILKNCYIRDEGIHLQVWSSLSDVGSPNWKVVGRSLVKTYKIERGDDWDIQPALPDLSVTFIEMNPKLAGLHGRIDYDPLGRPTVGSASALVENGDRKYLHPEEKVVNLKLNYKLGEDITLTAHVKNLGFKTAKPFNYIWMIDGKEVSKGTCTKSLKEMEEATFSTKYRWQIGFHEATFKIIVNEPEIAVINNSATDPLWGFSFTFIVHKGRVDAWHKNRTAYGTFSFEDFYRWHIDMMNTLFKASIYPAVPNGITARVRLDRIIYAEDIDAESKALFKADGIRYDQGGWVWIDDDDRNKNWKPPSKEWRNQTEWSLPHELGHQLGLVDHYNIDYDGSDSHKWADNGEKVRHFQNYPEAMMHWHGPQVFNEVDSAYLSMTWNKPRGYFGDYYFNLPETNYLRIVDVNGNPVPSAKVELFQRGVEVDTDGKPVTVRGVTYYPVKEDGNFGKPVGPHPVITGETNEDGLIRLPNRPADEVVTLNGFHRKANPFGNMNVVGERCLMMVKVTKYDRPCYYWLELYEFNNAWFRGIRDKFTITLKTPYRSINSPLPPRNVKVVRVDEKNVKVTWTEPKIVNERVYLDIPIGYRIYRRTSDMGLNDRPWQPVGTVNPNTFEYIINMNDSKINDTWWFTNTERFAVSSIAVLGVESELVEVLLPKQ